ncbi:phage regulatory CII family protein [Vibrio nigripulchritudo]|uniref:phage regulatory CII family protein n=1 Tax=Vibrio nigripulchritudo TaxID=28173 RepID=UPI0005FA823D|nr:phage regulatory CII family protein [Vibrio nigripulchritudo]KJY78942.1 phage regulatory protein (CII) [Vibrio nigripulchritudo]BDU38724.1 phage regulatory protein CII [Vibrio nigripulchritudo]BDU44444.1 phage regulatory protein CII [Vibrio nigripulchritudo]
MEANLAMCEFLDSAQHNFDEACVAFAQKHNLSNLADTFGIKRNVLRNMLNPDQSRLLTPPVLVAISKETGDYSIVYALLRDLDIVAAHVPAEERGTQETFLKRVLENSLCAGEFSSMALEHSGDRILSRSTRNKIISKAHDGISNLVLLIHDLEKRTGSAQPFFAMGVDFISNGAPIPGLT